MKTLLLVLVLCSCFAITSSTRQEDSSYRKERGCHEDPAQVMQICNDHTIIKSRYVDPIVCTSFQGKPLDDREEWVSPADSSDDDSSDDYYCERDSSDDEEGSSDDEEDSSNDEEDYTSIYDDNYIPEGNELTYKFRDTNEYLKHTVSMIYHPRNHTNPRRWVVPPYPKGYAKEEEEDEYKKARKERIELLWACEYWAYAFNVIIVFGSWVKYMQFFEMMGLFDESIYPDYN